jgi:predicted TIM-barrel fold metal-dependent hydrolase
MPINDATSVPETDIIRAGMNTPNRREILEGLAALGAGVALARHGSGANKEPRSIIDVHHHLYPPTFVTELGRADQTLAAATEWSPARSLEDMDKAGVATAITSITTPGVSFGDDALARRLARECNEYAARLGSDHAGRFGSFAILPWPNADASLREIEYSLDTLKADGIGMLTNYGDKWFGDPYFGPIFEELNRRKAVVYTHPTSANCCRNALAGIPDTAIEYGTDTSRAIVRTVFSGTSQRYPNIRLIFSHAGGTMPFLIERLVSLAKTPQYSKQLPNGYLAEATKFYYDTAQAANPAAMSALRKVVPISQIVFGTDYPFRTSIDHVKGLKECGIFSAQDLRAIERENALKLLPRHKS